MEPQNPNAYVKHETHKGITTITFYDQQSNSLPAATLNSLAQEITAAGLDNATKVIILKSEGDTVFCSGASFNELIAISNEDEGKKFFKGFAQVINAMRKCPKFIIGRIQGKCVGGGVGLAAAVDYAIATEASSVKLSELAIGIGPFVVGPAVERKIGNAAFSHLAIDAHKWRSADWAKRKGLYAEMHPNANDMDESIQTLANSLANSNPEAMQYMKANMWAGCDNWDTLLLDRAAISGKLILSQHSKNAIEAFKAKQKKD
jgi:methylglutaconyl-CoA hydratase